MNARICTAGLMAALAAVLISCGGDDSAATATAPAATGNPPATAKAGGTASPAGTTGSAKVPADACSLLTLQEVQTVAASVAKGEGKATAAGGVTSANCFWGPTGTDISSVSLTVTALPASRDQVRLSLQAEARGLKENGAEVSGIGDFAVFVSTIGVDAEVKAIVNGLFVSVDLNGLNARGQKEKVIALAKAAAGRLQ